MEPFRRGIQQHVELRVKSEYDAFHQQLPPRATWTEAQVRRMLAHSVNRQAVHSVRTADSVPAEDERLSRAALDRFDVAHWNAELAQSCQEDRPFKSNVRCDWVLILIQMNDTSMLTA